MWAMLAYRKSARGGRVMSIRGTATWSALYSNELLRQPIYIFTPLPKYQRKLPVMIWEAQPLRFWAKIAQILIIN
jgi:hypothetical protein